jgi:hypothetical protein
MPAFPNPTPVFPTLPGLTYSIHKRPTWATLISKAVSGREVRSPQQAFPLWEFELVIDFLRDQTQNQVPWRDNAGRHDLTLISQLYFACNGPYAPFYFDDESDNSRRGQVIGTGDGATTNFIASRAWGFGALSVNEPVGGINSLDTVYFNGDETSGVAYSFSGNVISFVSPPPTATVISIDFSFYYLCRFLEDTQDYEQFMKNLWTLKSLKFRSIKP